MLTVGQFATDVHSGKTVRVIGIQQVFGMVTYQVYEPETGNIYNAAERTLKIDRGLSEPSSAFVRFAAVYARVKKRAGQWFRCRCFRERDSAATPAVRAGTCHGHQRSAVYAR